MDRESVVHWTRRRRLLPNPSPLVTREYGLNKRHDRREAVFNLGIFSLDSLFSAYHRLELLIRLQ